MDRLDCFLHRVFINNGNSVDGLYVLQADIHGYYRTMRHVDAKDCFSKHLDGETVNKSMQWLQRQYPYDVGFEPGSQMVQILGISLLDPLDHKVKERLRAKVYERYMDDFYIISNSVDFLKECKEIISEELAKLGMELHPKKTTIYPLKHGICVLGFTFRITNTGKVLRIINPNNVKHERKKLRKMANLVKKGCMSVEKMMECYTSWKAHAKLGNSYQLLQRMDKYVKSILEEINNENHSVSRDDS